MESECKNYSEGFRTNMKIFRRVSGLLDGLERCAGLDIASICNVCVARERKRSELFCSPTLALRSLRSPFAH